MADAACLLAGCSCLTDLLHESNAVLLEAAGQALCLFDVLVGGVLSDIH